MKLDGASVRRALQTALQVLAELPEGFRDRMFLGFLFSEFDKKRFIERHSKPLLVPELEDDVPAP